MPTDLVCLALKKIKIAVLGIMPRPKESKRYDGMRVNVDRKLQIEVCAMKASLFRKREGDVSFLDMDSILPVIILNHIIQFIK